MLGYNSGQDNPFSVTSNDQESDSSGSQDSSPWGAGGFAEGTPIEEAVEKSQEAKEEAREDSPIKTPGEIAEEKSKEYWENNDSIEDDIDTGIGTDLDSWEETAAGKEALETGTELGQKAIEGLFPTTGQVTSGLFKSGVEGATGTDLDTGDNDNDGSKAASGLFKGLAGIFTGSGNKNREEKNFLEKLGLIDKILLLAAGSLGVKAYTARRGGSS
jgi:hypothetical protein